MKEDIYLISSSKCTMTNQSTYSYIVFIIEYLKQPILDIYAYNIIIDALQTVENNHNNNIVFTIFVRELIFIEW